MKRLNILIIDDHLLMVEAYENVLKNVSKFELVINKVYNCEQAYSKLQDCTYRSQLNLALLDLSLPEYSAENLFNGFDLALLLKKHSPECKLIIITSHSEAFLLYKIIKEIEPLGFLVKSEITAIDLLDAIEHVMKGEKYYSPIIEACITQLLSNKIYLDNYHRQIISFLATGIKTKNLPNYIPLSMSAIDKRKAQIKDYFDISNGNDEDIIREARKAKLI